MVKYHEKEKVYVAATTLASSGHLFNCKAVNKYADERKLPLS